MSALFRVPEAPFHARPVVGIPQVLPKGTAAPGVFYGPPSPGEVAHRLEHRSNRDGSKVREQWGSPMQFQPADRLPDVQARELVTFLLEQA